MLICHFSNPIYCEWSGASTQSRAFSCATYGTSQQQHVLLSIDFKQTVHRTKKFVVTWRAYIRDEPARLDPTMTLFDALYLSQYKIYKLPVLICCLKFGLKNSLVTNLKCFRNCVFFCNFFIHFFLTLEPLTNFQHWLHHMYKQHMNYQNDHRCYGQSLRN